MLEDALIKFVDDVIKRNGISISITRYYKRNIPFISLSTESLCCTTPPNRDNLSMFLHHGRALLDLMRDFFGGMIKRARIHRLPSGIEFKCCSVIEGINEMSSLLPSDGVERLLVWFVKETSPTRVPNVYEYIIDDIGEDTIDIINRRVIESDYAEIILRVDDFGTIIRRRVSGYVYEVFFPIIMPYGKDLNNIRYTIQRMFGSRYSWGDVELAINGRIFEVDKGLLLRWLLNKKYIDFTLEEFLACCNG